MRDEEFEEQTIKRQEIYHGSIIDVVIDDVRLPDGTTAKRELVFHPGAVAIIPITKDNRLVLVKQYRKPLEKVTLEIPAGKMDPEDKDQPIETAKRELEEETAYHADSLTPVTSMYMAPGFADEILHIFYGEGLTKVENPLPQDDDEMIELYELTLDEAKAALEQGLICDAKTIFALYHWELKEMKRRMKEA